MAPLSDEEIVRRVQGGERDLFLILFDRYYPRVERYARRQMQDAETARDIASETFLNAYRSVDTFRVVEGISFPGYLYLLCRRLLLNERKRQRSSPAVPLDEEALAAAEDLADTAPLPLTLVLDEERRTKVRQALDRLAPDDREIIGLAFEQELSRRDVMAILGKPSISAVTSHLHRAMQKLKTVLVQQDYFVTEREPERE
jgi:RNA polymerase sigma-70 factor (ECF subfamily)